MTKLENGIKTQERWKWQYKYNVIGKTTEEAIESATKKLFIENTGRYYNIKLVDIILEGKFKRNPLTIFNEYKRLLKQFKTEGGRFTITRQPGA